MRSLRIALFPLRYHRVRGTSNARPGRNWSHVEQRFVGLPCGLLGPEGCIFPKTRSCSASEHVGRKLSRSRRLPSGLRSGTEKPMWLTVVPIEPHVGAPIGRQKTGILEALCRRAYPHTASSVRPCRGVQMVAPVHGRTFRGQPESADGERAGTNGRMVARRRPRDQMLPRTKWLLSFDSATNSIDPRPPRLQDGGGNFCTERNENEWMLL
jgi:hypothetical protein